MKIIKWLFVIGFICYSIGLSIIVIYDGLPHRIYSIAMTSYIKPPKVDSLTPEMKTKLAELEVALGYEFTITNAMKGNSSSTHRHGLGVDIRAHHGKQRNELVRAAIKVGFNRIGVYDKHIHVDIGSAKGWPQNVMWWGKSK